MCVFNVGAQCRNREARLRGIVSRPSYDKLYTHMHIRVTYINMRAIVCVCVFPDPTELCISTRVFNTHANR